jgi:hypothetical protein
MLCVYQEIEPNGPGLVELPIVIAHVNDQNLENNGYLDNFLNKDLNNAFANDQDAMGIAINEKYSLLVVFESLM